jgi:hypothetical protein
LSELKRRQPFGLFSFGGVILRKSVTPSARRFVEDAFAQLCKAVSANRLHFVEKSVEQSLPEMTWGENRDVKRGY